MERQNLPKQREGESHKVVWRRGVDMMLGPVSARDLWLGLPKQ